MAKVRLIVGLGNPGGQYELTRHNAGFWFVEEIARQFQAVFRPEAKFFGDVCSCEINGEKIWLLKPQTFMNRSGQAISALAKFYKLNPENILVVHDELDLAAGVARLKSGGGHGGHNGLRDAVAAVGAKFLRLRLGIGHPGDSRLVVDYVLKKPSKLDKNLIEDAIYSATRVLPDLVEGDLARAMNFLHTEAKG